MSTEWDYKCHRLPSSHVFIGSSVGSRFWSCQKRQCLCLFFSSSPVPAVLVLLCGGGGGGGHVHDGGGAAANGPHGLVSKDLEKKKKEASLNWQ